MLTDEDIKIILNKDNNKSIFIGIDIQPASNKVLGYLGEHLTLKVKTEIGDELKYFVKCVPRDDETKAFYIKQLNFNQKEYSMLAHLFKEFGGEQEPRKWRPKTLLVKEDLFVFEDMIAKGYVMPDQQKFLNFSEIQHIVKAVAQMHSSSYIYEERMTKLNRRHYRIYENYEEYLQESPEGTSWRNAGTKAVIDFLCVYSKYKDEPNFREKLGISVPMLYAKAKRLMRPSTEYRNVVVHTDLWSNNLFIKYKNKKAMHAVIVDFQTVLYASPLLDLASLLYFNTDANFRKSYTSEILNLYYKFLTEDLQEHEIEIGTVISKESLFESYDEAIAFGLTQACLVVPMIATDAGKLSHYFDNADTFHKIREVSRSEEVIEIASTDNGYKQRVLELFEEIVDRYVHLEIYKTPQYF